MDRVTDLTALVQKAVADYAGPSLDETDVAYYVGDNERQIYMVVITPNNPEEEDPVVMLMARVVDNTVIITTDITDRPLFEALVQLGVPREQIILAYEGEKVASVS